MMYRWKELLNDLGDVLTEWESAAQYKGEYLLARDGDTAAIAALRDKWYRAMADQVDQPPNAELETLRCVLGELLRRSTVAGEEMSDPDIEVREDAESQQAMLIDLADWICVRFGADIPAGCWNPHDFKNTPQPGLHG